MAAKDDSGSNSKELDAFAREKQRRQAESLTFLSLDLFASSCFFISAVLEGLPPLLNLPGNAKVYLPPESPRVDFRFNQANN